MGEICASGSVGGEGGNVLAYPATYTAMLREKVQAAPTARPKVPMRRLGAHCLVVALKRGNARGAKGAGHQRWIRSTGNGRNLIINGRRQPSLGGTSRMMREYHVRICEGLGVKFPGSTRQRRLCGPDDRRVRSCPNSGCSRMTAAIPASGREPTPRSAEIEYPPALGSATQVQARVKR